MLSRCYLIAPAALVVGPRRTSCERTRQIDFGCFHRQMGQNRLAAVGLALVQEQLTAIQN
jgi:hypothetical protein